VSGVEVSLVNITKSWANTPVLQGVNLNIPAGKFTAILGPSGCGKSTLLRIIAGLEMEFGGTLRIDQKMVNDVPADKRGLSFVFQSYALFPHLTVADNILFGLRTRGVNKQEQQSRLNNVTEMLGIGHLLKRKPAELSGGQQQRVSLGRAIIGNRPICLMDEPLSNLDAKLRHTMRTELKALQKSLGFTMIYVTHDQVEAITMADQVALLNKGQVAQFSSAKDLYDHPQNTVVAQFIGTPPMNIIPKAILIDDGVASQEPSLIGIRPEHIRLSNKSDIKGRVVEVEYLGADAIIDVMVKQSLVRVRQAGHDLPEIGDMVGLSWPMEQLHFFDSAGSKMRAEDLAQQLSRRTHVGTSPDAAASIPQPQIVTQDV